MQRRKVIVRKLNGEIIKGHLETIPQLRDRKEVSIVSLTEELITVPKQEIKALFFVRKFSGDKEYSEVKFFQKQPRIDGLWVRDSDDLFPLVAEIRYPGRPNPWGATGLEWRTPSPPPTENFRQTPIVTEDPYEYSIRKIKIV